MLCSKSFLNIIHKRGPMNKKRIAAIMIYLGLIAVCLIALYVVPSVRGMLERTYIAEYGSIDVTDEVSAFIVRDETVYVADEPSKLNRLAEHGRLVKAGTKVVELKPDEEALEKEKEDGQSKKDEHKSVTTYGKYDSVMRELGEDVKTTDNGVAKISGYVNYYIDGAETKLGSESMNILDSDDFEKLADRDTIKLPSKKCGRGYPVFKITRNGKWYLVYYLSNKDAAKYEVGNEASIDLDGTSAGVTISDVQEDGKNTRITLTCKSYFERLLEARKIDTTVTIASAEGLVLKDSSLVEDPDGRIGVFVINKLGEHVFKPVSIKADDGERCVVYSDIYVDYDGNFVETISTYDEIIEEPSKEDIDNLKEIIKKQKEEETAEAERARQAEEAAKARADALREKNDAAQKPEGDGAKKAEGDAAKKDQSEAAEAKEEAANNQPKDDGN